VDILCLDLEGVLVPEVWQAVAKETQIPELLKTTRDIPNYDDLMNYRLESSINTT
jgi:phosphoserine/homoserine phosphotransferase